MWHSAVILLIAALSISAAGAQPYDELAPKGSLRVAIAISPAPSALYAIKDANGQYKGVTVDLGEALAAKIGRPVQFMVYPATGEIVTAGDSDAWDVTFMPHEAQRARAIDFGAAYHLQQSTFLMAGRSGITRLSDVDRAGIRIAGVEGAATARAAALYLKQASLITARGVAETMVLVREEKADGIALGRESLLGLQGQLPGSRLLDDSFLETPTAVAVPKGRTKALAYVSAFMEEQKANGSVRKSLDAMGLTSSQVAPAGMTP